MLQNYNTNSKATACAGFIGATAPNDETNQHVVSLVVIGYYNAVNRGRYEKIRDCDLCQFCDDRRCRSGSGVYEHPARCSPDGAGAATCRTEFEFLLIQKKFMAAPNKLQLVNPLAPRQYGSDAQVVVADPQDPQERPYAVRLFSIAF